MRLKNFMLVLCVLLPVLGAKAQPISWTETTSDYNLPEGITIFKGERTDPPLECWYMKIDLTGDTLGIRPYYGEYNNVPSLTDHYNAYAAVNGGFFGGTVSYSAILEPGVLTARNVASVTRDNKGYPVMRSFFSFTRSRNFGVDWIYHFGNDTSDIYAYESPMDYEGSTSDPLPAPEQSEGTQLHNLWTGIGGGPTLVKEDSVNVTYNEEIFWGSGVGRDNPDPRTAVGYTDDGHAILFVADGRKSGVSEGVSLPELAQIMLDLGCTEAMNLDGGGSTQMAIGDSYVNAPNEQRSVPCILAIVHKDSMKMPGTPDYENIIDTDDQGSQAEGDWFETANQGFYGDSKSMLAETGDGSAYYNYSIVAPKGVYSTIYGWWVASSNRSSDTPYIIKHKYGTDTVEMDQSTNGSQWVEIGKYVFEGDSTEFVKITNEASTGTYVVADAIKVASFMEEDDYTGIADAKTSQSHRMKIVPNPVTSKAKVIYRTHSPGPAMLQIISASGKTVKTLQSTTRSKGRQSFRFSVEEFPAGIYGAVLQTGHSKSVTKFLVK